MKEYLTNTPPRMTLTEWQDLIDGLITEHGPDAHLAAYPGTRDRPGVFIQVEVRGPPLQEPLGAFKSYDLWVGGQEALVQLTAKGHHIVFFDKRDRYCPTIRQKIRAREEGTFPLRYWLEKNDG